MLYHCLVACKVFFGKRTLPILIGSLFTFLLFSSISFAHPNTHPHSTATQQIEPPVSGPLLITKESTHSGVSNGRGLQYGDAISYTIQITNTSLVTVSDIVIKDLLPLGASQFVTDSAVISGATAVFTPPVTSAEGVDSPLQWQIDRLPPSQMVEVSFAMRNGQFISGTVIANTATVTSSQSMTLSTASVTDTVVAPLLKLDLMMTDANGPPLAAGDPLILTVAVQNLNAGTIARNIEIREAIPTWLSYVPGSIRGGDSSLELDGPTLVWTLSELNGLAAKTVSYSAYVSDSVVGGTQIDRSISATSDDLVIPDENGKPVRDPVVAEDTYVVDGGQRLTILHQMTPPDGSNFAYALRSPSGNSHSFVLDHAEPDDGDSYGQRFVAENTTPGLHTLSIVVPPGWSSPQVSCTNAVVTFDSGDYLLRLDAGVDATCTVTSSLPTTLTLIKEVVNDDGGTARSTDFSLLLNEVNVRSGVSQPVEPNQPLRIDESGPEGYALREITGEGCPSQLDQPFVIEAGDKVVCKLSSDDIAPTLALVGEVLNDSGGTATASDFVLRVDGLPVQPNIAQKTVANLPITVRGEAPTGYRAIHIGGPNCPVQREIEPVDSSRPEGAGGTPITLPLAIEAVCVITFDDIAPTLTLTGQLINDDGGTATIAQLTMIVDGQSFAFNQPTPLLAERSITFNAMPPTGYRITAISGVGCPQTLDEPLRLTLGQSLSCTLTIDDIAPTITLIGQALNNAGGTVSGTDFTFLVDGESVNAGETVEIEANRPVSLMQTDLPGYELVNVEGDRCPSTLGGIVQLALDEDLVCTIINRDIAPSLIIQYAFLNDGSYTVALNERTFATDLTGSGETSPLPLAAGEQQLSLSLDAAMQQQFHAQWGGDCALDGRLSLALGQDALCTVTFNQMGTVRIVNRAVPANIGGQFGFSGTLNTDDFTLENNSEMLFSVEPGAYNLVGIDIPSSFDLTNLTCVDSRASGRASNTNLAQRTAFLLIDAAETVTCTFTYTARGRILARPITNPGGISGNFTYDGIISGSVSTGQSLASPYLRAGRYEITQSAQDVGFHLDQIECSPVNATSALNPTEPSALFNAARSSTQQNSESTDVPGNVTKHTDSSITIDLAPGAEITCLFTNEKAAVLIEVPSSNGDEPPQLIEGEVSSFNYNIRLNSRPDALVTLLITSESLVQPSKNRLYFDTNNWFIPQQVYATVADDSVSQSNLRQVITHRTVSLDSAYNGNEARFQTLTDIDQNSDGFVSESVGTQTLEVEIVDDDIATILFNVPENEIGLIEGNGSVFRYWVSLLTQPTDDVVVFLVSDDQMTTDRTKLVFDEVNWSTPQSILVSAVDDAAIEGDHHGRISHRISTTDLAYDQPLFEFVDTGFSGQSMDGQVTLDIEDNDIGDLQIVPSTINLVEGDQASYEVSLTHRPVKDVVVSLSQRLDPSRESPNNLFERLDISPTTLRFTAFNWSQPQRIAISLSDNTVVDGSHWLNLSHSLSSADPNYDRLNKDVRLLLVDNEETGIIVSPTLLNLHEGDSGTIYSVALTSQPSSVVTVFVEPDGQLNTDQRSLTFTPTNWRNPQAVLVSPTEDAVAEGLHWGYIRHRSVSVGGNDIGDSPSTLLVADTTVAIEDNDEPGVWIEYADGTVSEDGTTGTYELSLLSQPRSPVVIQLHPNRQLLTDERQIVFTRDNWAIPQSIRILANDDDEVEASAGETHAGWISHGTLSFDPAYHGLRINDLRVSIIDNDQPAVLIGPLDLHVSEDGQSAAYQVQLTARPPSTVSVQIDPDRQIVEGIDESLLGDGENNDNVRAQITTDISTLTFDASNWHLPQWVTVHAEDDPFVENGQFDSLGNLRHLTTIHHHVRSQYSPYNGINVDAVKVGILDNDSAGIVLSESRINLRELSDVDAELSEPETNTHDISVAALSANRQSYGVSLSAQPTAPVLVTVTHDEQVVLTSDANRGALDSSLTLRFDADNWQSPQLVHIAVVDDDQAEKNHESLIHHTSSSDDQRFNSTTSTQITVAIADDDSASVFVQAYEITVSEEAQTTAYEIVLTHKPSAPVRIIILAESGLIRSDADESIGGTQADAQNQLLVNESSEQTALIFTEENWNQPQLIRVRAVSDSLIESLHSYRIQHKVRSVDADYHELKAPDVIVRILDNDEWSDPDLDRIPTMAEDLNHDRDPTNDDSDGDEIPNFMDDDDDGDGLLSRQELGRNSDGDLVPDYLEDNQLDSDSDSVPDYRESGTTDTDNDGLVNELDADDDGDEVLTTDEDIDGNGTPLNDDSDGDTIPNYLDADDDGDSLLTIDEGTGDRDGDGRPDYLDNQNERASFNFSNGPLFTDQNFLPFIR